ncbi:MAG: hypothetical protein IPJ32_19130 [Sphingobacteriaceae bacterium]|nr:hypothetical protein [Sphingobacteriaceae bacterium]
MYFPLLTAEGGIRACSGWVRLLEEQPPPKTSSQTISSNNLIRQPMADTFSYKEKGNTSAKLMMY